MLLVSGKLKLSHLKKEMKKTNDTYGYLLDYIMQNFKNFLFATSQKNFADTEKISAWKCFEAILIHVLQLSKF